MKILPRFVVIRKFYNILNCKNRVGYLGNYPRHLFILWLKVWWRKRKGSLPIIQETPIPSTEREGKKKDCHGSGHGPYIFCKLFTSNLTVHRSSFRYTVLLPFRFRNTTLDFWVLIVVVVQGASNYFNPYNLMGYQREPVSIVKSLSGGRQGKRYRFYRSSWFSEVDDVLVGLSFPPPGVATKSCTRRVIQEGSSNIFHGRELPPRVLSHKILKGSNKTLRRSFVLMTRSVPRPVSP